MNAPLFTPTAEQQEIVRVARDTSDNMIIRAYAGCAKTSSLELIARALPTDTHGLFLAFNTRIKEELAKRMPDNFTVMTLNGLGHRAWGSVVSGRLTLDNTKVGKLTSDACKRHGLTTKAQWALLLDLVNGAMGAGLVPREFKHGKGVVPDEPEVWATFAEDEAPSEQMIDIAREVLTESIARGMQGLICYNDQIYLPVCFGGSFPGYPLVMVDEAQDLSKMNAIMLRKTARKRLIIVGDEKQAVYAWRGADSNSIENLKTLRDQWTELPLHTTFRCPKVAVDRASAHAPGFTAGPLNKLGTITALPHPERQDWTWRDVQTIAGSDDIAVLCRNNAPLLSMAFKLLRQRIGVKMLGRDIGKTLVTLARKLMPLPGIPIEECVRLINDWMEREVRLATANQDDARMERTLDRGESLLAVVDSGATTSGELVQALEALFVRDGGQVTLSTIHRAKGLEWDTIIHLDFWRIPSKWARTEESQQQERNLKYVCETRMKEHLILASKDKFL